MKLKKLQTAETVKWHKMQKVTELVQSAHMDKIHQQAKLVQMVKVIKQAKTVKGKITEQTSWIDLFATELRSF